MLIEVYCSYCGLVLLRTRRLLSISEIYRRVVSTSYRCPGCGRRLSTIDESGIRFEFKPRRRRETQLIKQVSLHRG